ncbi:MAG TPA: formimidoylglutamate deiminase [Casimicrobiaceae bacterium]|jgi:formimidoylglutamate deiminase|nr:formimidoylglutamate deiminase [Casimicrobiaceae bacterium]
MRLFARDALLPAGWAKDVVLDVGPDGIIEALEVALSPPADAERVQGPLIPGMPNVHSHAFQRALAGLTERGGPATDNFWSWREAMYRFVGRIGPADQEAIAAQLYIEMLKAGYTAVAEFQYLHHDPAGEPYANQAEMATRIIAASIATGIGLTLLPVFYAHSDFGGAHPTPAQRRFLHDPDDFRRLMEILALLPGEGGPVVGIAPHSLRAVTPNQLQWLIGLTDNDLIQGPIHIHAAEQRKEVDACVKWSGQRPVQWLLNHAAVDARWCIVHATHVNAEETKRLAESGAVAGLCPSTEADLGDGIFPSVDYLAAGGRIGIGGDSHVGVDPFAELRLIDAAQRLTRERRNLFAKDGESSGLALFCAALTGGAQALAQPVGAIALGSRADLVVLDANDPGLVEQPPENLLDAAIFGPGRRLVRDVMVAGRWVIGEGHHADEEAILVRYRQTMRRLLA